MAMDWLNQRDARGSSGNVMLTVSPTFHTRLIRAKVFGAGVGSGLPLTSIIAPFAHPGIRNSKEAASGDAGFRVSRTVFRGKDTLSLPELELVRHGLPSLLRMESTLQRLGCRRRRA